MVVSGVLGLIALGVVLASLVYLHVAPTGLSPLRNAVSQYGITVYRTGYRIATIAFGVVGIAVAAGIEQAEASHEPTAVLVLLAIFALSRGAISWYPMDAPGTPQTATGRAHWAARRRSVCERRSSGVRARSCSVPTAAVARPGRDLDRSRLGDAGVVIGDGLGSVTTRPPSQLRSRRTGLLRERHCLVHRVRGGLRPSRPIARRGGVVTLAASAAQWRSTLLAPYAGVSSFRCVARRCRDSRTSAQPLSYAGSTGHEKTATKPAGRGACITQKAQDAQLSAVVSKRIGTNSCGRVLTAERRRSRFPEQFTPVPRSDRALTTEGSFGAPGPVKVAAHRTARLGS